MVIYWGEVMKTERKEASEAFFPEREDYRFMQEIIKRRPVPWRKITGRIGLALGMGVLFGVAAGFTMEVLRPAFSGLAEKESDGKELFLNVEQKETEANEEIGVIKREAVPAAASMQELEAGIYQIAENARPFMVNVISGMDGPEWSEEISGIENQSSGIIINMEEKVLILANRNAAKRGNYIRVQFCDGSIVQGYEISYDILTNISIIQVDNVPEETRSVIKAASFSGEEAQQGELVLALGRPLGSYNTIVYGHIAGQSLKKYTDALYRQIFTDISGSTKGQGILINENGQVLAFINQNLAEEEGKNLITALGTLEIQNLVEKLMTGENPGYLGIEGEPFSAEKANVDYKGSGVYVTKVKKDLPALTAGIQAGDIITKINGEKVADMKELQKEILKYTVGDEVTVTLMRLGRGEFKEMTFEVKLGGY